MEAYGHRGADRPAGHYVGRSAPLQLVTGLLDDARATIAPGHELYERAAYALRQRDRWSAEAHGAFFTGLLPAWPAMGRRPVRDALSVALALLTRDGLSEREAAETVGVSWDTVRPRERPGRERPSVERGDLVLVVREAESYPVRLRRLAGSLWVAPLALPRVFEDGEEQPEPEDLFVNPLVELLDGEQEGAPAGELYLRAAQGRRRQLWHERRGAA